MTFQSRPCVAALHAATRPGQDRYAFTDGRWPIRSNHAAIFAFAGSSG
jgi:hypothetical protein